MDLQPHPDDHEAKMARADLFKLAQYSFKLFKMIHEDMELEGWVQAKITKAADYIASVYHYMEYEMKFSEYGEKLENSDVYSAMSESQRQAIVSMLTEAKATMKKLTAAQAKKLKKKDAKVEEGLRPGFDAEKAAKDNDKMKAKGYERTGPYQYKKTKPEEKKDDKVKEGFPTVDDARKRHEQEKGTGKFDKKEMGDGRTQYTRKSSTFTDGGDDSDVKAAKKKEKKVKEGGYSQPAAAPAAAKKKIWTPPAARTSTDTMEGPLDTVKKIGKKVAGAVNKAIGHGSDEEMIKDLQRKSGAPVTGKKPAPVKEASKAKKDYDGDGKVESPKDEVWGSRAKAAAKAGKPFKEAAKPDYIDLDKDGNKKEPMKKAAKDAKSKKVEEGSREMTGSARDKVIRSISSKMKDTPQPQRAPKDQEEADSWARMKRDQAAIANIGNRKVKEAAKEKCNHTPKGKSCPVHGLKECGGMYEGSTGDYSAKKAAAGKDIGKPGKNFAKIEKSAGGGEKGKRIAGAVLAKLRKG